MERESFEDEAVARIMNANFVNVIVDREERPDIDKIYMIFVQATTGSGGWPMSVFITPDLEPFFGGTYFPSKDQYGMPSFKTLLFQIVKMWKERGDSVKSRANELSKALKSGISNSLVSQDDSFSSEEIDRILKNIFDTFNRRFDERLGGFGSAPKFPGSSELDILLRLNSLTTEFDGKEKSLHMVLFTLRRMSNGGIYDHIGGGFHHYSVDDFWHVPHFEKMLYDNSQLLYSLAIAYRAGKAEYLRAIASQTAEHLRRDFKHPEGGLFSAEDADSYEDEKAHHKKEGAFYVWSRSEIESVINDELSSKIFCHYFHVEETTNTSLSARSDPRGEFRGVNVLIALDLNQIKSTAEKFNLSESEVENILEFCRKKLFNVRLQRPRPFLDDKVVTSWNGMAITGLCCAHKVFTIAYPSTDTQTNFLDIALGAAKFVKKNLYNSLSKRLIRNYRNGASNIPGFLCDYACMIRGLILLYEVTANYEWLQWAFTLQQTQDELFWDKDGGGYFFTTADDSSLLYRTKEDYDGSEPSPNSIAVLNLLKLSEIFDNSNWKEMARTTLLTLKSQLIEAPHALPLACLSLDVFRTPFRQIVLSGETGSPAFESFQESIFQDGSNLENTVILYADQGPGQKFIATHNPHINSMEPKDGKTTLFVCKEFSCQAPVTDPEKAADVLK